MKIILMRHGRPIIHLESMRADLKTPAETGQVIRDYKFGALDPNQTPPENSINIAKSSQQIFSSDLPRAVGSVNMLGVSADMVKNECFRESDHPYFNWQKPKLKFFTWCILFRLMWFFGFSKNGESIKIGRKRAQISAAILSKAAQNHDAPMLLGHGIINRLIMSELKKQGWRKTEANGHDYWSYIVLEKN